MHLSTLRIDLACPEFYLYPEAEQTPACCLQKGHTFHLQLEAVVSILQFTLMSNKKHTKVRWKTRRKVHWNLQGSIWKLEETLWNTKARYYFSCPISFQQMANHLTDQTCMDTCQIRQVGVQISFHLVLFALKFLGQNVNMHVLVQTCPTTCLGLGCTSG